MEKKKAFLTVNFFTGKEQIKKKQKQKKTYATYSLGSELRDMKH